MWIVPMFYGLTVITSVVQVVTFLFRICRCENTHFDLFTGIVLCFVDLFSDSVALWWPELIHFCEFFRPHFKCKCFGLSVSLLQPFHYFQVYWVWSLCCCPFVWMSTRKVGRIVIGFCESWIWNQSDLWIAVGAATHCQKLCVCCDIILRSSADSSLSNVV
jgi:hypothetical protein